MNPQREAYVWQAMGQYVYQLIWSEKKPGLFTFIDDITPGGKDGMKNDKTSILKAFQEQGIGWCG